MRMPSIDDVPEEFSGLTRDDLKKKYRDETAELETFRKGPGADTLRRDLLKMRKTSLK